MEKRFLVTDYGAKPDIHELQTERLQAVFDLCRDGGGTVVIPKGRFLTGGLRMWSDTTLYLESGAALIGSDICEDYAVFDVPAGVELRTDMELITQYYKIPWKEYRRAILSVYGGKNISVIGEPGSVIDGQDCADPHGEEGYRGPHGVFFTNVKNITLRGYTIQDCGNFMHQIDNCSHIRMNDVVCQGGSDGIHLHHCKDTIIEKCVFHTGDDCVAGINAENLIVRDCEMNTSCQLFRMGGEGILVENCRMWGPGIYPHRMTVVQNRWTELVRDRANTLPRECGRHNMIALWQHFASTNFPFPHPYRDVTIRNCVVENVDKFMNYHADGGTLESGTYLEDIRLENVTFTDLGGYSLVEAAPSVPLTVHMKNVRFSCREGAELTGLFDGKDRNTIIVEEESAGQPND